MNALDGQPFFVVPKEIDPGRLHVIEPEIVPRLESDLPAGCDHQGHRCLLVFDRAGYRPAFFARMGHRNIACLASHKFPGAEWPAEPFVSTAAVLPGGEHLVCAWTASTSSTRSR